MPQPREVSAEAEADRIVLDLDAGGAVLNGGGGERLGECVPVGSNLIAQVHPKEREFVAATLAWIAGEAGRGGAIACRLARPNGSWLAATAELRCKGATVVATISTDEIRAARRAETQMRHAIEASRQGVVVRTADELLYINDGFARLIGYDDHRDIYALGQSELENFIHPDDRNTVIERVRARMAGKEAVSHYELRLVRRDTSALWVAVAASSVIWDGKPASLSWLTDIDERKRAENALITSKEEAEFANRAKTDFLAHMSHELRTPLNAVLGFSEMIASQAFGPLGSPKYLEYADDIHRSGSHLLDLINDVLDLSKIEAGRLELHETEICLPDL
ncbi:MAG: histidine kinase dimerization/phospho-acceptor domain-containing protein, partial [Stellaceae bacterium]